MVDNNKKITRVLFCGPHFPASQDYTREYLNDYPFVQVEDVPFADVPDVIEKYDICIVKNMKLDFNVLSRAKKMKLIMQYGVGLEGVEIDAATKFGIKVARIPSHATGNAASCAEMAIYLMLGLLRKQNEMQISIKQRKLGDPIGETLLGKTVFILGYGNIGMELAKRLKPFGVKIIATKRNWDTHSEDSCQSNGWHCKQVIYSIDEKGLVLQHSNLIQKYNFFAMEWGTPARTHQHIFIMCRFLPEDLVGLSENQFTYPTRCSHKMSEVWPKQYRIEEVRE